MAGANVVEFQVPSAVELWDRPNQRPLSETPVLVTLRALDRWLRDPGEENEQALREAAQPKPRTVDFEEILYAALNRPHWRAGGVQTAREAQKVLDEYDYGRRDEDGNHIMRLSKDVWERLVSSLTDREDKYQRDPGLGWSPMLLAQLDALIRPVEEASEASGEASNKGESSRGGTKKTRARKSKASKGRKK